MKMKSIVREFGAIHLCFWESGLGFLSVHGVAGACIYPHWRTPMKPHHFHIGTSILLGVASLIALFKVEYAIGGLLAVGAVAALIQWKAVKSGLVDL